MCFVSVSIFILVFTGVTIENLRLRFALLQSLNNSLESFFLPLVDLRPEISHSFSQSMSSLLAGSGAVTGGQTSAGARSLIFYDSKIAFFHRVLNASATARREDQAAPQVTLDPLENITGET